MAPFCSFCRQRLTIIARFVAVLSCSALFGAALAVPQLLTAQNLVDVTDSLYLHIDEWTRAGYLTMVPDVRPFPRRVLVPLLERVVRVAPAAEARRAQRYLDLVGGSGLRQINAWTSGRALGNDYRPNVGATLNFAGEYAGVDALVDFAGFILDQSYRATVPRYVNGELDTFEDTADATIGGRSFLLRQSLRLNTSIGHFTPDQDALYGQAGIMRSAWGPFPLDNAVLGGQAPHHPSFSWYWAGQRLSFSWLYNELTATNYLGKREARERLFYGGKHFMFHNLRWRPFDWLELSYLESVTWGPEWDLRYFLPFHSLFYTQSFSDFGENSMLGVAGTIRLPEKVTLDGTFLVDDGDFNKLVRLNFARAKFLATIQAGVTWSPLLPWLRSARLEYLAVTPYTYTHQDEREQWIIENRASNGGVFNADDSLYLSRLRNNGNFQNYTHFGHNIGPTLLPNSDRLSLALSFTPADWLDLTLRGRMIRHGNASTGQSMDSRLGTGGLLDDGYDTNSDQTYANETRFLTQSILERVLQGTVQAAVTVPVPFGPRGLFVVGGSYTIEHIQNPGLVVGERVSHFWTTKVEYRLIF